jgi:hypothetical protein
MGLDRRQKAICSQGARAAHPQPAEGAALFFSRRIDDFLSIHQAGNKSGELLLTTFVLTLGAATNGLP